MRDPDSRIYMRQFRRARPAQDEQDPVRIARIRAIDGQEISQGPRTQRIRSGPVLAHELDDPEFFRFRLPAAGARHRGAQFTPKRLASLAHITQSSDPLRRPSSAPHPRGLQGPRSLDALESGKVKVFRKLHDQSMGSLELRAQLIERGTKIGAQSMRALQGDVEAPASDASMVTPPQQLGDFVPAPARRTRVMRVLEQGQARLRCRGSQPDRASPVGGRTSRTDSTQGQTGASNPTLGSRSSRRPYRCAG